GWWLPCRPSAAPALETDHHGVPEAHSAAAQRIPPRERRLWPFSFHTTCTGTCPGIRREPMNRHRLEPTGRRQVLCQYTAAAGYQVVPGRAKLGYKGGSRHGQRVAVRPAGPAGPAGGHRLDHRHLPWRRHGKHPPALRPVERAPPAPYLRLPLVLFTANAHAEHGPALIRHRYSAQRKAGASVTDTAPLG